MKPTRRGFLGTVIGVLAVKPALNVTTPDPPTVVDAPPLAQIADYDIPATYVHFYLSTDPR